MIIRTFFQAIWIQLTNHLIHQLTWRNWSSLFLLVKIWYLILKIDKLILFFFSNTSTPFFLTNVSSALTSDDDPDVIYLLAKFDLSKKQGCTRFQKINESATFVHHNFDFALIFTSLVGVNLLHFVFLLLTFQLDSQLT